MKPLYCLADICNGRGSNLEAVGSHVRDDPFAWTSSHNSRLKHQPSQTARCCYLVAIALSIPPPSQALHVSVIRCHVSQSRGGIHKHKAQAQDLASGSPSAESGPS